MAGFFDPILEDVRTLAMPALVNVYFTIAAIPVGFAMALGLALLRTRPNRFLARFASGYVYFFRGSPFFIQLFAVYTGMLALNLSVWRPLGIDGVVLHPLFLGPLVLTLNTAAYTGEILYGALQTVPKGQLDAARAFGMGRWRQFRSVVWPNVIRVAWPAYTNEVVFIFQATALIYFTLPVINGEGDLLNVANELFNHDFNATLHYAVAGLYFLVISFAIYGLFGLLYRRMMRHMQLDASRWIRWAPRFLR